MLTALSLVLAAVASPAPLSHVAVALPSRDTAILTLTATWNDPAPRGVESQRLLAADVSIPLAGAPAVTVAGGELRTEVTVRLKDVPEAVLNLDPNSLPLRWEGLDRKGRVAASLAGTVDLGDREQVSLPIRTLYDQFLLVRDVSASPGLSAVGVRALLGFYNPFAFDVVATRVEYRLDVAEQPILEGKRPGFRLRGAQWSDILIEQDVPLGDVMGAVASFLGGEAVTLTGALTVRTPQGEKIIPLVGGFRR